MATFNFTVDRLYKLTVPVALYPSLELGGQPRTVPAGETLVYKGSVEIGGVPRYAFVQDGQKGFTRDRAALEQALQEDYGSLIQVGA